MNTFTESVVTNLLGIRKEVYRNIMRRSKERRPEMEEKINAAERRMRDARGRLRWRVNEALIPLQIQKDHTISALKGEVLIISYNDSVQEKLRNVLESESYRFDIVERTTKAVGMLKMAKYKLIIVDYTRYRRSRIFEYVARYHPHIKIVSIVSDDRTGRWFMSRGCYSYLIGRHFDEEQLRICLVSSLRMGHRVCTLLKDGEKCNRSCVNNYQTEDDFLEDADYDLTELEEDLGVSY